MTEGPRIAVAPAGVEMVAALVEGAGGTIVEPDEADALIWTDPADPNGLKELLTGSPARWVQLPFAGIESFFDAGAIDPARTWTCAKGIYGPATAEHALALMLMAARRLHVHATARAWTSEAGVGSGFGAAERRLASCTVVIVGTGGIGRALTEMLRPLGPRILAANRSGNRLEGAETTVPSERIADVLPEADFVVLAAAHTPQTHHLIDAAALDAMREGAWLVNVARGGLVDTEALVDALRSGRIGGAALDVTDPEPLPEGHPLWELPNAVVTPHVANTWDMAVPELAALVGRNVAHFAAGEPLEGLVDPASGY
ncbi:MAG TPA: D-isomer specific 2-hydroxyacid dehydrogenase family protein [Actinomycetota bacterium]|nr:D-isomer specific 2-hydroxyacid dehydrogenase family protein [Actinomycetota bacterium]